MGTRAQILAVDDDSTFLRAVRDTLQSDYDISMAEEATAAMRSISQRAPDLLLLDYQLPQISGLELLKILKRRFPEIPIIMLTAEREPDTIIETMKSGANDYVVKGSADFESNLRFRIEQALERLQLLRKNRVLLEESSGRLLENQKLAAKLADQDRGREILGVSKGTLKLKRDILMLKGSSASVLITGENGTGKELVARALNRQEDNPARPFVDVNCSAINPNLFESEFFGHVKGSFTGSTDHRDGKFKLADGGDIFLDEIGEIPLDMQSKLLRVLQERTFTPVGGNKQISVNVRVIAATNRDLEVEVQQGRFRQDLFYRLNPISIHVLPLRERKEDIDFLAGEFMRRLLPMATLSSKAKALLNAHPWYGNIRELHNAIERAVVFAKGSERPVLKPEHFLLSSVEPQQKRMIVPESILPSSISEIAPEHFERSQRWMERQYLLRGLEAVRGDNEVLYQRLGMSRAQFFKRKKILSLRDTDRDKEKGA